MSILSICRDRRGAVALEFALIGSAFLAMLLGSLQICVYFYAQTVLDTVASATARGMQTGVTRGGAPDIAMFRTTAFCPELGNLLDCSRVTVSLRPVADYKAYMEGTPALIAGLQNPATVIYDRGTTGSFMLLQIFYQTGLPDWPFPIKTVLGTAAYQNE